MSNPLGDLSIKLGNKIISNYHEVKLLGIMLINSLNFDSHVEKLCKKANQNLHALARPQLYGSRKVTSNHEGLCHISIQLLPSSVDVP